MIAISEIKLLDLLVSKFKLSVADAKDVVIEFVHTSENIDRSINEKVETRFVSLKETFATKDDIRNLKENVNETLHKLDIKIEQTKNDMVKWMFGFWITIVLLLLANWFLKK